MIPIDLRVTGVQQEMKVVGRASARDAANIAAGLRRAAEVVLRKSRQYVPVDTGALRASGHVETEGSGFGAESFVIYGGEDAHYALYVHEDLTKYHEPPTQAKFLERAAREVRGTIASILRRAVQSRTVVTRGGEEA